MTKFTLDLSQIKPVNSEPYPFTELQANWLNALESGKYKQGQGMLCTLTHEYCCLGVLAELMGAEKTTQAMRGAYRFHMPGESSIGGGVGMLTYTMRKLTFLKSDIGDFVQPIRFPGLDYGQNAPGDNITSAGHGSLASMNDVRMIMDNGHWRAFNFQEIAAYIRHDPWNVFHAPESLIEAANKAHSPEGGELAYA